MRSAPSALRQKAHANGLLLYAMLLPQQGPRGVDVEKAGKNPRFADDEQRDPQPLEIGSKGGVDAEWPGYRAWDYACDAVRERNLAIVEEVLARYPVDGFELQLNYCPYYFHPDEVAAGTGIMTEWIGRVLRGL